MVQKIKWMLSVLLLFILFIEATRGYVYPDDGNSAETTGNIDERTHRIERTSGKFTTSGIKEDLSFTIENIFNFSQVSAPYITSPDLSILYTLLDEPNMLTIRAYSIENKVKMVEEIKLSTLCKTPSWNTTSKQSQQTTKSEEILKFSQGSFQYIGGDSKCVLYQGSGNIYVVVLLCNEKTKISAFCYNIDILPTNFERLNKNMFIAMYGNNPYLLRINNSSKKIETIQNFGKKVANSHTRKNIAAYDDKKIEIYTVLQDTIKLDRTLEQKDIKIGESLPYFQVVTFSEDDKYLIIVSNYNIVYFYNLSTKSFDTKLRYDFGKLLEDQQIITFFQPWNGKLGGLLDTSKKVESQHAQPDLYTYIFGEADYKNKKTMLNKYKEGAPIYYLYFNLYDKISCDLPICIHIDKKKVAFHTTTGISIINKDNNEVVMRYYPPESYTIYGIGSFEKRNNKYLKFVLTSKRQDRHTIHGLVATLPLREVLEEEK